MARKTSQKANCQCAELYISGVNGEKIQPVIAEGILFNLINH